MTADFAEGAEEGGNVRWLLGLPIQTAQAGPNHEGTPMHPNGRTLRSLRWLLFAGWIETGGNGGNRDQIPRLPSLPGLPRLQRLPRLPRPCVICASSRPTQGIAASRRIRRKSVLNPLDAVARIFRGFREFSGPTSSASCLSWVSWWHRFYRRFPGIAARNKRRNRLARERLTPAAPRVASIPSLSGRHPPRSRPGPGRWRRFPRPAHLHGQKTIRRGRQHRPKPEKRTRASGHGPGGRRRVAGLSTG